MVLQYRAITLYGDGSYKRDADAALDGGATGGGSWRKEATNYLLAEPGGKVKRISAKMLARPARRQQTLSGRYSSMSGLGGGMTGTAMVAAFKDLYFSPDGTLRMERGAGASTHGTGGDTTVVTSSKANNVGRYKLDGYTITLTLDDGKTEQKLFYFFPDSEKAIGVGAATLSRK